MWNLPATYTSFEAVSLLLFFGSFLVFLICAFWRAK